MSEYVRQARSPLAKLAPHRNNIASAAAPRTAAVASSSRYVKAQAAPAAVAPVVSTTATLPRPTLFRHSFNLQPPPPPPPPPQQQQQQQQAQPAATAVTQQVAQTQKPHRATTTPAVSRQQHQVIQQQPKAAGGWLSKNYYQDRRTMIAKIACLLKQRKPNATKEWLKKLPQMAQRLELSLYNSATSFDEYNDSRTLKHRLQQLAVNIDIRAHMPRRAQQQQQAQQQQRAQQRNFPLQDLNGGRQSDKHYQMRKNMIDKIANLLQQQKVNDPQQQKVNDPQEWLKKLPQMAQRLELSLYRSATSFDEYNDARTLKHRLNQLLAINIDIRAHTPRRAQQQQQAQQQQRAQQRNFPLQDLNGGRQSDKDYQMRKNMIAKIAKLLQQQKGNDAQDWLWKLPQMAERLEESLYRSATSSDEYNDASTLKHRLNQLLAINKCTRTKQNLFQHQRAQQQQAQPPQLAGVPVGQFLSTPGDQDIHSAPPVQGEPLNKKRKLISKRCPENKNITNSSTLSSTKRNPANNRTESRRVSDDTAGAATMEANLPDDYVESLSERIKRTRRQPKCGDPMLSSIAIPEKKTQERLSTLNQDDEVAKDANAEETGANDVGDPGADNATTRSGRTVRPNSMKYTDDFEYGGVLVRQPRDQQNCLADGDADTGATTTRSGRVAQLNPLHRSNLPHGKPAESFPIASLQDLRSSLNIGQLLFAPVFIPPPKKTHGE